MPRFLVLLLGFEDRVSGVTVHVRLLELDDGRAVVVKGVLASWVVSCERIDVSGERNC